MNPTVNLVKFAGEHLDAHDGEDEPEDETDEKHVEDGRDRLSQGVDHDLQYSTAINKKHINNKI